MYAVLSLSGHQYRVTPGATLVIDRVEAAPGETLTLADRVLLLDAGDGIEVGTPVLEGAEVDLEVIEHFRGPKIIVFKMKRRKRYRRKKGFRAELSRVRVKQIRWNGAAYPAPEAEAASPEPASEEAAAPAEPAPAPETVTAGDAPQE